MTDPGDAAPSGITNFHDMIKITTKNKETRVLSLQEIQAMGKEIKHPTDLPQEATIMYCPAVNKNELDSLKKNNLRPLLELWKSGKIGNFNENVNRMGLSRALNALLIRNMTNSETAKKYLTGTNNPIPEGYKEIGYDDPSFLQDDTEPIMPKDATLWKTMKCFCFGNKLVLLHDTQRRDGDADSFRICLPLQDLALLTCKYAAEHSGFSRSIQRRLGFILRPRFYTPRNLIMKYRMYPPTERPAPQQVSTTSGAIVTTNHASSGISNLGPLAQVMPPSQSQRSIPDFILNVLGQQQQGLLGMARIFSDERQKTEAAQSAAAAARDMRLLDVLEKVVEKKPENSTIPAKMILDELTELKTDVRAMGAKVDQINENTTPQADRYPSDASDRRQRNLDQTELRFTTPPPKGPSKKRGSPTAASATTAFQDVLDPIVEVDSPQSDSSPIVEEVYRQLTPVNKENNVDSEDDSFKDSADDASADAFEDAFEEAIGEIHADFHNETGESLDVECENADVYSKNATIDDVDSKLVGDGNDGDNGGDNKIAAPDFTAAFTDSPFSNHVKELLTSRDYVPLEWILREVEVQTMEALEDKYGNLLELDGDEFQLQMAIAHEEALTKYNKYQKTLPPLHHRIARRISGFFLTGNRGNNNDSGGSANNKSADAPISNDDDDVVVVVATGKQSAVLNSSNSNISNPDENFGDDDALNSGIDESETECKNEGDIVDNGFDFDFDRLKTVIDGLVVESESSIPASVHHFLGNGSRFLLVDVEKKKAEGQSLYWCMIAFLLCTEKLKPDEFKFTRPKFMLAEFKHALAQALEKSHHSLFEDKNEHFSGKEELFSLLLQNPAEGLFAPKDGKPQEGKLRTRLVTALIALVVEVHNVSVTVIDESHDSPGSPLIADVQFRVPREFCTIERAMLEEHHPFVDPMCLWNQRNMMYLLKTHDSHFKLLFPKDMTSVSDASKIIQPPIPNGAIELVESIQAIRLTDRNALLDIARYLLVDRAGSRGLLAQKYGIDGQLPVDDFLYQLAQICLDRLLKEGEPRTEWQELFKNSLFDEIISAGEAPKNAPQEDEELPQEAPNLCDDGSTTKETSLAQKEVKDMPNMNTWVEHMRENRGQVFDFCPNSTHPTKKMPEFDAGGPPPVFNFSNFNNSSSANERFTAGVTNESTGNSFGTAWIATSNPENTAPNEATTSDGATFGIRNGNDSKSADTNNAFGKAFGNGNNSKSADNNNAFGKAFGKGNTSNSANNNNGLAHVFGNGNNPKSADNNNALGNAFGNDSMSAEDNVFRIADTTSKLTSGSLMSGNGLLVSKTKDDNSEIGTATASKTEFNGYGQSGNGLLAATTEINTYNSETGITAKSTKMKAKNNSNESGTTASEKSAASNNNDAENAAGLSTTTVSTGPTTTRPTDSIDESTWKLGDRVKVTKGRYAAKLEGTIIKCIEESDGKMTFVVEVEKDGKKVERRYLQSSLKKIEKKEALQFIHELSAIISG
jgi:hypothetical protein